MVKCIASGTVFFLFAHSLASAFIFILCLVGLVRCQSVPSAYAYVPFVCCLAFHNRTCMARLAPACIYLRNCCVRSNIINRVNVWKSNARSATIKLLCIFTYLRAIYTKELSHFAPKPLLVCANWMSACKCEVGVPLFLL